MPHPIETNQPQGPTLRRLGGKLCLDFINTVESWRDPANPENYLVLNDVWTDYRQVVFWAHGAEIISGSEATTLSRLAEQYPDDAATIHQRTIAFRNALHSLFTDYIHGREADPKSMAIINVEIADTFSQSRLWWYDDRFTLESLSYDTEAQEQLDEFLEPVVHSAIELLTSPAELKRVRECPGEDCGWLFYDSSGRRRWCSMEDCGNAAKVRRFRERQKTGGA